ncbi:MAG: molybdopterin-dependent oxidoreductase [Spirochaetaceae bacterium]|nr:molybdopterin-dependent oxidoreductase [Spirochaetaceae bacterium]
MEKPLFVDDIIIKNCLSGILLRSPVVSGFLKEIKAPRLPYNVSLVAAADIPGKNYLAGPGAGVPVFPKEELAYYGQPVALILGPDPVKLRELAEQCEVLAESVPEPAETGEPFLERNYRAGNAGEAFEKAWKVVEGSYTTGIEDPWPSDPAGAVAVPGPGSSMAIHTATQWPGHVRDSVSGTLDIKPAFVTVEPARLEIHLEGKLITPSLLACQAALGSYCRKKPVKLILKRDEDFRYSPKSLRAEIRIRTALGKGGQILGTELTVRAHFGAFGIFTGEILDRIALGALGAYNHESLSLRAGAYSASIPPAGPAPGFGLAQGFFAAERHASRIADTLGEDPSEWRKNFFLRRGKSLPAGIAVRENPPVEELLDTAAALSDYRRKWAANELLRKNRRKNPPDRDNPVRNFNLNEPFRGIGITLAYQGSSFLYHPGAGRTEEGIELTLEKDGALVISTDFPWGDNQLHPWKTLAAKILGVEELRISRTGVSGKPLPEAGPACLSRSIAVITGLVEKACIAIRKQRFRNPLPITVRRYYHPGRARVWEQYPCDENVFSPLSWGSAVVEAEIDPVEYIPRIRGIWMALEGGTILAEDRARKSLANSAIQALSWAAKETTGYTGGRIAALPYPLPRMEKAPEAGIDFLWSEGKSRGVGELPFYTVPAAYVQALSQALDYPFQAYPVSSGDIWTAVQNLFAPGERE